MLSAYKKEDPPPHRVKPVPVSVLRRIMVIAAASPDNEIAATADMIALGFFFLLRPGEYCISSTSSDSKPFLMQDTALFQGERKLDFITATDNELLSATFGTLEFTTQKNSVRGEVVGLAPSGDLLLCPCRALARRIIYLRSHNAPVTTPLARYFSNGRLCSITPSKITATLQAAVTFLGPSLGFLPGDVSARSLRAAGANALLFAEVDTDVIRLIGRWRSDEMLRYLHLQAAPAMRNFSRQMLQGGDFTLIPNHTVGGLVPLH